VSNDAVADSGMTHFGAGLEDRGGTFVPNDQRGRERRYAHQEGQVGVAHAAGIDP
jgi:hypothetical protein